MKQTALIAVVAPLAAGLGLLLTLRLSGTFLMFFPASAQEEFDRHHAQSQRWDLGLFSRDRLGDSMHRGDIVIFEDATMQGTAHHLGGLADDLDLSSVTFHIRESRHGNLMDFVRGPYGIERMRARLVFRVPAACFIGAIGIVSVTILLFAACRREQRDAIA